MRLTTKLMAHGAMVAVFFLVNLVTYSSGVAEYNKKHMTWFDILDYTIVTWMTVGFGNVYPTNAAAKMLSWAKMTAFLILVIA